MLESNLVGHLDADTLAAFAEHALNQHEATMVFSHLSECERCRNWFGVHVGLRRPVPRRTNGFYPMAAAALAFALLLGGRPKQPDTNVVPKRTLNVHLGTVSFATVTPTPHIENRIALKTASGVRLISLSLVRE